MKFKFFKEKYPKLSYEQKQELEKIEAESYYNRLKELIKKRGIEEAEKEVLKWVRLL